MGQTLLKVNERVVDELNETSLTTQSKVDNTLTEELVIGICSPIGSLKEEVINTIKEILVNEYEYDVQIIKLSSYIDEHGEKAPPKNAGETESYTNLRNKINGGNNLREKYNDSILAEFAVYDMYLDRMSNGKDLKKTEDLTSRRKCFIIDSIKHIEELKLLRSLYRDIFYLFSVFSPEQERKAKLHDMNMSKQESETLFEVDAHENSKNGQKVRDTFVDGDFFVRVSSQNIDKLKDKISRYIHLMFESKIITPNAHEIAMYEARSAAGNSACLSRQVGAAITNSSGEIISRGWNDVPKIGGNLYKDGEAIDKRCFQDGGFCRNDITKNDLAENIYSALLENEELKQFLTDNTQSEQLKSSIVNQIRNSTKIKDLIEFSRAVHAEMHAIIIGSQLADNKMIGGKLFCTTYPCHNCGRHIIVAGIKEIYYIEPYVKSLCIKLHPDALTENEFDKDKVQILMFDGVAPRRFLDFFSMHSHRKIKGVVHSVDLKTARPKSMMSLQALPILEAQAIHYLKSVGIINPDND